MHDFDESHPEKKGLSVEDTDFLTRMKEEVVKEDSGHYCLPLPFRNPGVTFPNNRAQAVSRAGTLKKKMLKDKGFQAEYNTFVQNMLNMGFAKKVPDIERNDPNVWYIPHHAVFHPTAATPFLLFLRLVLLSHLCGLSFSLPSRFSSRS